MCKKDKLLIFRYVLIVLLFQFILFILLSEKFYASISNDEQAEIIEAANSKSRYQDVIHWQLLLWSYSESNSSTWDAVK